MTTNLQIAVLDHGFVYVGHCALQPDGNLTIRFAHCLRRWGTTRGLGEIALGGPTAKTQMDLTGTVHVPASALISLIDCDPAKWDGIFGAVAA